MKRLSLLIPSLLAAGFVTGAILYGQATPADTQSPSEKKPGTITVTGSATVRGKPDSVRVFFAVVTNRHTVAQARAENARTVGQIQDALQALQLKELKTRTTDSRVSIIYDEEDRSQITGYTVRQSFTVLLQETDPEKLGAHASRILDAGLQNGANGEGNVHFFKEDDTELKRQAMTKAVEDALANAKIYAASAGVKITAVAEIEEYASPYEAQGLGIQSNSLFPADEESSLVAGDWQVPAQVRIVCHY